jgi:hypothetical protein
MFNKKKKNQAKYDYVNGYVVGVLDALDVLKLQKLNYGELANINDLISLINKNADVVVDNLINKTGI